MRKKLIKFLLKLLGHDVDKVNVIKIEVDAEDALRTLKKIQYEVEQIANGIDKLPKAKAVIKFSERTSKLDL